MPLDIIPSSTGVCIQLIPANNRTHVLLEGETVISTGNTAIRTGSADNIDVSIAGTVIGEFSGVSPESATGSGNSITVQSTGTVISNSLAALFIEGDISVMRNFGQVTSFSSPALTVGFGSNSLLV